MRRILIGILLSVAAIAGLTTTPAAAATGWTTIHRWPGGSVFLACKYAESGPYGPVWQVRLVLAHNPGEPVQHLRAGFTVRRMGRDGVYRPMHTTSLATDNVGQWDLDTATGSQLGRFVNGRWNADRWSWGIGDENGGLGDTDNHRFGEIKNCG